MLEISKAWKNAARLTRVAVPLIRLYHGTSGECYGLSTIRTRHDGVSYRGLVKKLPTGSRGFDIRTHEPITGNWRLRFNNGLYDGVTRLSDKMVQVSNREVEIRLWVPGITTWADLPVYMVGLVRKVKHNDKEVTLEVEDRNRIIHREVPGMVGSSDAADAGQGLPEGSLGKVKPIVCGDHTYLKGDDAKSKDIAISAGSLTPCVDKGLDSSGNQLWLLSGHQVDEISVPTGDQIQLWGKDPNTGRFVRLHKALVADVTVVQNTSDGCIVSVAVGYQKPAFHDYWYGRGTVTPTTSGDATAFSNPARVIDKIFSIAATGSVDEGSGDGDYTQIVVPFPIWDNKIADASIIAVFLEWYGKITYGGGDFADFKLEINTADQHGFEPEGAGYPEARVEAANAFTSDQDGVSGDATLKLSKVIAGPGSENASLDIYEMYKKITYVPEGIVPLYFAGKGLEYGEAVNGRSTAEGYSESHADDDGSGDLIENPAGIVEWMYRKYVEQNAEQLNENSIPGSPTKWSETGDFIFGGGGGGAALDYTLTGSLNGILKQTAANRRETNKPGQRCRLKYTVSVSAAPDGDFALKVNTTWAKSAVSMPFTAGTHIVDVVAGPNAATADLEIEASESTATQGVIGLNDIYLESDEIDLEAFNVASRDRSGWKMAPFVTEKTKTDKIIGEIAKQCGSYVWHQPGGTVKIRALEGTYTGSDVVIDLRRALSVDFEWSPMDWLKARVKAQYDWNGERYLSQTPFAEDADQQDYYNVDQGESTEWIEARGLHDQATAEAWRDWYLAMWKQQHIMGKIKLPLEYVHVDAGDIAAFTNGGKAYKVYGEDITENHTRSGQTIYKYFLVYKVDPLLVGSMIHVVQLHDLSS